MVDYGRISTGPVISDTNLHHVAVTKSGDTLVFYGDGVGTTWAPQTFGVPFQFTTQAAIGVRSDCLGRAGNRSFYGTIDEVSFYNRALSADEIGAIYAAGIAGKCRSGAPASLGTDRNGGISIVGTVGARYCVRYVGDPGDTNWTKFTNFVLPHSPYRILAPQAPHWSNRYYRVEGGAK